MRCNRIQGPVKLPFPDVPGSRRALMARVKSKDSRPELAVRRMAHSLGYRFRLHRRDLPGTPDLVFPGRRKVLFVHGCFWHHHEGCGRATIPRTRTEYWRRKFADNKARDAQQILGLRELGWEVLVVWECETLDENSLAARLRRFMEQAP